MNSLSDEALKVLQFALLTDAQVKQINDNFVLVSTGGTIFTDLQKANQAKHSLKRSWQRFVNGHPSENGTVKGVQGNKIDFVPLPVDFQISDLITRKTGNGKRVVLPEFDQKAFKSQFPSDPDPEDNHPSDLEALEDYEEETFEFDEDTEPTPNYNENITIRPRSTMKNSSAVTNKKSKSSTRKAEDIREPGVNPFGTQASILRQNEEYEGKMYDFVIQLQMCPETWTGTTGFPFNIITAVTQRGGIDSKDMEHTLLNVLIPVENQLCLPIHVDDENYPRLGKKGDCILVALKSKSWYEYEIPLVYFYYYLTFLILLFQKGEDHTHVLGSLLHKSVRQFERRLEQNDEFLNSNMQDTANSICRKLEQHYHRIAKEKKNIIRIRLLLPHGFKGTSDCFQTARAKSVGKRGGISPELILCNDSVKSEIVNRNHVVATKFAISLLVSVNPPSESSTLFQADSEIMEQDEMVSRMFMAHCDLDGDDSASGATRSTTPRTMRKNTPRRTSSRSPVGGARLKSKSIPPVKTVVTTKSGRKPAQSKPLPDDNNNNIISEAGSMTEEGGGEERELDPEDNDDFQDSREEESHDLIGLN